MFKFERAEPYGDRVLVFVSNDGIVADAVVDKGEPQEMFETACNHVAKFIEPQLVQLELLKGNIGYEMDSSFETVENEITSIEILTETEQIATDDSPETIPLVTVGHTKFCIDIDLADKVEYLMPPYGGPFMKISSIPSPNVKKEDYDIIVTAQYEDHITEKLISGRYKSKAQLEKERENHAKIKLISDSTDELAALEREIPELIETIITEGKIKMPKKYQDIIDRKKELRDSLDAAKEAEAIANGQG